MDTEAKQKLRENVLEAALRWYMDGASADSEEALAEEIGEWIEAESRAECVF